jgi:phage tail-like protein
MQPDSAPLIGEAPEAGFQAVTTPEFTVEMAEYREGTQTYTQKYPGIPSTNDLTMTRGAALNDTAFLRWVKAGIEGREYRTDLTIYHAPREDRTHPFNATTNFTDALSRRYQVQEAVPMRVKPAADLDAGTSDVSLAEVDVAFENFEIVSPSGAGGP